MKKTLLILSSILISACSFAQYQGFENWSNNNVQLLDDYETSAHDWGLEGANSTFPSTDAFTGTYSIRLETTLATYGDTIFGFFISGDPDTQAPGQMVTLPAVDSIIGYYKYDIMPGDSALILIGTSFMSTLTGGGAFYVKGQQSTWKRFSYPVMAPAADSMLVGAATGDPINNFSGIPGSWIQFDDVQIKDGVQTQNILNSGFENWTPYNWEDITGWYTANIWAFGEPTFPVVKTTDANSGSFAAELSVLASVNNPGDTLWGAATNGYFGNNGPMGGEPFTGIPTAVECYYKYAPVNSDNANVNVEFFKNGSSIGVVGAGFNATVSTYTLWNQAISLPQAPDTLLITLWAGNQFGSVLKVDDIDFVFPLGIEDGLTLEKIVSYPNPATDELNIRFNLEHAENVQIRLIDLTGKTLETRNLGQLSEGTYRETFTTSTYSSGMYFLEFELGNKKQTKRFIVK